MKCRDCKEVKEPECFSLLASGHRRRVCKKCRSTSDRATAKKNGRAKKPPTAEQSRGYMLKHRYGMTTVEYDNMYAEQDGLCAVCSDPMDGPHVDHCHATGKVRGLLCSYCNKGLGHFFDDPDRLREAAKYLEGRRQDET